MMRTTCALPVGNSGFVGADTMYVSLSASTGNTDSSM
jgi:hypothetical protein